MGEKVLTCSEVMEIVYNSDESFRDSRTDSVSSIDNEIDDIAVADANSSCSTGTFRTLFGRGITLWIENFFNSPQLARKLKIENSTDCVGTLKLNRKNVHKEVKDKKLEKGKS